MGETKTFDLSSQVDGVNNTFITPDLFTPGTLVVHVNGLRLRPDEYTETGTTTFSLGGIDGYPTPLRSYEHLVVQYETTVSGFTGLVPSGIDPSSPC
jgi:hypothetical protein